VTRVRADLLAAEQGLAGSQDQAARLIMAGRVFMDTPKGRARIEKPGQQLKADAALSLDAGERFVSRGGHKLLTAIEHFGLDVAGLTCLDAGASTGGFTDCLLQHGAALVYAVDVGTAQLHEKLRGDPRVVSREGVNLRLHDPSLLPGPVDLITADLSFISLRSVLPALLPHLKPGGRIVALVKPQFELARHQVGQGGVVREESLRQLAVERVTAFAREGLGLAVLGVVPSALKGPQGNQEYLVLLHRPA